MLSQRRSKGTIQECRRLTEPVQRVPQEYFARENTAAHLVHPFIVECHKRRDFFSTSSQLAGLDAVPEKGVFEDVLTVALLCSKANELPSLAHDRSRRRRQFIGLLVVYQDSGAEEIADRRQRETEPETDEVLGVDHGNGAGQGASIDEHVEVDVDTRCGGSGINNLLLAVLPGAHIRLLVLVLFCDERRDVGLETASTDAHDNKASGKDT